MSDDIEKKVKNGSSPVRPELVEGRTVCASTGSARTGSSFSFPVINKRNALIWGAGGFVGGELLRLIATHPNLMLRVALSATNASRPIAEISPSLSGWTNISFDDPSSFEWDQLKQGSWTIFAALGHGEAMNLIPPVLDKLKGSDVNIVDLSGDFRLKDTNEYRKFYGRDHSSGAYIDSFVYGLPEINRSAIRESTRISNPGCLATGAQLAILPAAASKSAIKFVAIDGKTGSSGAGAKPKETTHHPLRMNNFRAYLQLKHQHIPEITGGWLAAGGSGTTQISFVPQMAPMVRGIFTTAHIFTEDAHPASEVIEWYRKYYSDAPFVRIIEGSPEVAAVWGTNRCDISIAVDGKKIVVCTAIDNLMKGAAGQAIQNANIMNGWDETAGLSTPPPSPV